MQKIGFLGMGVMGLPMAKNVVQKCGLPVLGYDVVQKQMDAFREAGGIPVSDPVEIYKQCDVVLQILPTHPIIRNSVEQAIQYGKPGNVIVDLSSTAPDTRVMTCLPSAISGTASSMGFIMSSTGFICAAVSAMPESDMNAPVTMP